MSQLIELFGSRKMSIGDNASAEIRYLAIGFASEEAAVDAAGAAAPEQLAGLSKRTVEIAEHLNNTHMKINVKYGEAPAGETFYPNSSADTTGGTLHITQSLETLQTYSVNNRTPSDLNGAIGFDGENVAGCDIVVPVCNFTETRQIDEGDYNLGLYFALTGKVNNQAFKGFPAGTVLFQGAQTRKNYKFNFWECDFRFSFSPAKNNFYVGRVQVANKPGWAYMWVQYGDDISGMSKIKEPWHVRVERVYDEADLNLLPV